MSSPGECRRYGGTGRQINSFVGPPPRVGVLSETASWGASSHASTSLQAVIWISSLSVDVLELIDILRNREEDKETDPPASGPSSFSKETPHTQQRPCGSAAPRRPRNHSFAEPHRPPKMKGEGRQFHEGETNTGHFVDSS